MARLFRRKDEKKSVWRRVVDLALTDVRVVVGTVDSETLESVEERLLTADFGVTASLKIVDHLEQEWKRGRIRSTRDLEAALRQKVGELLGGGAGDEEGGDVGGASGLRLAASPPTVYLVAGVNGVGKTTSVGKLAHRFGARGDSVLVAAADTYRAGAVEQLRQWAERTGADFVGGQQGGDPASVAFDALEAAERRGVDVVLIDTAGRLHTQRNLMEELGKIDRVVRRRLEGAPHETLLVLDATVGQNALRQVEEFGKVLQLTGILLTKLDSTARGGVVVALREEYDLPVKLVGFGEEPDDLEEFEADSFVRSLVSD